MRPAPAATVSTTPAVDRRVRSVRSLFRRRQRRSARPPYLALAMIALLCLAAILAPLMTSQSPTTGTLSERLLSPGRHHHLLGTDQYGRDIFTRLIYGSQISLEVGFVGVVLAAIAGSLIGLLSGLGKRWADGVLMRLVDVSLSIPSILLAVLLAAVFGPSLRTVFIAIALLLWQHYARVVRGETLALRERHFIAAARIAGASMLTIAFRHILPNVLPSVTVMLTLDIGTAMLTEASLSYLGVGIPPPAPSWGNMVNDGQSYMTLAWWLPVLPGVLLFLAVISFNSVGDWTRSRLDPRLQESV